MLTEHFSERELGVEAASERERENARWLCEQVLEYVRERFGRAVVVHCGRRSKEHNRAVGGKTTSWHLYEGARAAADVHVEGVPLVEVFEWMHRESGLNFDKVILEFGKSGESRGRVARCIHVQAERGTKVPRRLAYVGETGACVKYTRV